MKNKKINKYLIKYTLELIVIVLGISVSFWVNNWNESTKQTHLEAKFIKSVKEDLKQDKEFIIQVINGLEPKIKVYHTLINEMDNLYYGDRTSLDSLFKIYSISQRTFYPIFGSYKSAVSGNQITVFNNKELIQKIIKLYNSRYDRLQDNGRIADERWDFFTKKYSGQLRLSRFTDMDIKQRSEFLNDMHYHIAQMRFYNSQLKSTLNEINEILNEN